MSRPGGRQEITFPALTGDAVPAHIAKFIDDFYRVTDEEQPDKYIQFFTPDADFHVVAPRKGHAEIHAGCLASYKQRDNSIHRYEHILVTQPDREVYVTGDIDFDRKVDGELIRNVPWVARCTLNGDKDNLKMSEYYVWVVSQE